MIRVLIVSMLLCHQAAECLNVGSRGPGVSSSSTTNSLNRRSMLGLITTAPFILTNAVEANADDGATITPSSLERAALLAAIDRGANEEQVMDAIQNLIPQDPSKGKSATMPELLDGEWKLLWSAKAEAFSPLLQLPPPLKPTSYQYFGKVAEQELGSSSRVGQGLTGGWLLGDKEIWLSSGTVPSPSEPDVLVIQPPFRLQFGGRPGSFTEKSTLVESKSDAEFRANAINSRTKEAQAAPQNKYQQLYVEKTPGKGALRISTVASGDPVIVGAIFVHEKL